MSSLRRPAPIGALCLLLTLSACSSDEPAAPEAPGAATTAPAASAPAPAPSIAEPAAPPPDPQDLFWQRLTALCGLAYGGFLTVGTEESDRYFGEAELIVHVTECSDSEIRIPFHVSEDRSRTFVLRRAEAGLTLHHRHLDKQGNPDGADNYGGATRDEGAASRQEFIVEPDTVAMLPESRYNVWALEIEPGNYLAYELKRVEEERFFRVEFSLAEPVDSPPAAWGSDAG